MQIFFCPTIIPSKVLNSCGKEEEEIKALLTKPKYAREMEPYLAKQRRAEVNFKILS